MKTCNADPLRGLCCTCTFAVVQAANFTRASESIKMGPKCWESRSNVRSLSGANSDSCVPERYYQPTESAWRESQLARGE
ncbi:uncharacterized protein K460DRAFT_369836 [Cucurbitaria berberidis CBS 394.84]|uniref:Uncharacterized protein n=1 Tax=Cucurbitaria berberidis CBS 394.84 TaxID=1168544 RepID=A0A9P4GAR6_9PLEO|nr:uncharacterized protein K460DRAFT_369836 [Cucurbitaria berberidis CBS 394.84]KAF1841824.1 hypothetical protein K460DRAFT_369836 [Cucurbitaria berberidis CBS 394.84]